MSSMPNLTKELLKILLDIAFINTSASCSSNLTNGRLITFESSFSLMKCLSNSMCFVLSYCIGLCEISIAALLSQKRFISPSYSNPSSSSNFLSHNNSHILFVISQNSSSALERATIFCFLLLYVKRFPPTNVKYPAVDIRSIILPAQSTFV
jgi:hypothetical protein